MTIQEYIDKVNEQYKSGNATEHTYRGELTKLITTIVNDVVVTNEPKRQKCGAPDYIITKKNIPVGFIEAKDIGDTDLEGKKKSGHKEQFDRYKKSLNNLIFTDYLDFILYHDGVLITKISIGEITDKGIVSIPNNFSMFEDLLKNFCIRVTQTIKNPKQLAQMMAGKARLLSDVIEKSLVNDDETNDDSTLKEQMIAFRDNLIHDIEPKSFADVYAQTITYGMFAARLHDSTLENFSRQEASELIPKSNPFLRKLFGYIAGPEIDDRIKWIVDDLANIFLACNVKEILQNYGRANGMNDAIIHFYETFLAEYDPKLRKARGVWYTPKPVVNFIVRAVDDILKSEFNLPKGLADTSKIKKKVDVSMKDGRTTSGNAKEDREFHKVQILDPATGTGTFLAEVIEFISEQFKSKQGMWSSYVENEILPRLNGFELLMASYAMAHLKIDMLLDETGYKSTKNQRTKIYLTNSLEEHHSDTGTLFASWLSAEANEANHIKRDTPVMCVIGNPPYSVSSTNKSAWIENLIADYKRGLNEKSYNSLSDDYVKFIRYGQHFIDKNGSGILAYISNNSFVDGLVFRQMRKNLLESFDKIYILDLHGNTKKKEVCKDGSQDKNVFDIQQGVSINIFVKTGMQKKGELAEVFNLDLQGKRDYKYNFLMENSIKSCNWVRVDLRKPEYYFTPKNYSELKKYKKGLSIQDIFIEYSSGIQTEFDGFSIQANKNSSTNVLNDLKNLPAVEILGKYNLDRKYQKKVEKAIYDIKTNSAQIMPILYRPFDVRSCVYTGASNGIMGRPRDGIMRHFLNENDGLAVTKLNRGISSGYCFRLNSLSERHLLDTAGDSIGTFPLYLYPDNDEQQTINQRLNRTPNLDKKHIDDISKKIKLIFTIEKESTKDTFAPIDVLDYIYAVLHSPAYRKKYKEFLKIDFPRVPYPKDKSKFWKLVELGGELRKIHLLESNSVIADVAGYPKGGSDTITTKVAKKDWELYDKENQLGCIWINEDQYFDGIPVVAWEFYIGGYQPAQKWLKDRKGKVLSNDDVDHYQKIIVALTETDRLMQEIDKVGVE